MNDMAVSTTQDEFATLLERVARGKERIVLRQHDLPVAAVIPVEDLELLERLIEQEEDRLDIEEAERILADPTEERIPLEKVGAELGV